MIAGIQMPDLADLIKAQDVRSADPRGRKPEPERRQPKLVAATPRGGRPNGDPRRPAGSNAIVRPGDPMPPGARAESSVRAEQNTAPPSGANPNAPQGAQASARAVPYVYVRKEAGIVPVFLWEDESGNLVRRSNADPTSEDYDETRGPPQDLPDVTRETVPQMFTPDGIRLNRAIPDGAAPEFNPAYNPDDPLTWWLARFALGGSDGSGVEAGDAAAPPGAPSAPDAPGAQPNTPAPNSAATQVATAPQPSALTQVGWAYSDRDMHTRPELRLHTRAMEAGARLPRVRERIAALSALPHTRARVEALALSLVANGLMLPDLLRVKVEDASISGNILTLRLGRIDPEHLTLHAAKRFALDDALAQVAVTALRGAADETWLGLDKEEVSGPVGPRRPFGPHQVASPLAAMGAPAEGLLAFGATVQYARRFQRALMEERLSLNRQGFEVAHERAVGEVAAEMAVDIRLPGARQIFVESFIDPIAIEKMVLTVCGLTKAVSSDRQTATPKPAGATPVRSDMRGFTQAEVDVLDWMIGYPVHEHVARMALFERAHGWRP